VNDRNACQTGRADGVEWCRLLGRVLAVHRKCCFAKCWFGMYDDSMCVLVLVGFVAIACRMLHVQVSACSDMGLAKHACAPMINTSLSTPGVVMYVCALFGGWGCTCQHA
jgi:hypothetical protein